MATAPNQPCGNGSRARTAFGIHSAATWPYRPQEFPMQIQVHAGSRVGGGGALIETVTSMTQEALTRFAGHVTRIDVHMSDENGSKGGKDKRCVVEAHMEGRKPVAVTDNAETMKQAVQGALQKLVRMLDSTVGRMREHRKDTIDTDKDAGEPS
jgi:ribosome-associated translation inhibitor RaiA